MTETNKPAPTLQAFMRSNVVQQRIVEALSNQERAQQFTTSLMSAINQNTMLQTCEPWSVLTAAMTAASMDLPIQPGLGYAAIVPYWDNSSEAKEANNGQSIQKAQFQIMAKGFKQLALRTGRYHRINETDVREGEYKGVDRRTGDHKFEWIADDAAREKLKVVGYLGYIRLASGFEKELYMTVDELKAHAKKYSKLYQKGGGQWADVKGDGFDRMCRKTVIKLLISRHGETTTTVQKALLADQAALGDDDTYDYLDNKKDKPAVPAKTEKGDDDGSADTAN